jgi:two-component system, sensor histidine kinase
MYPLPSALPAESLAPLAPVLDSPHPAASPPPNQATAEQVANLYSFLPTTLAGNAGGALVLGLLFWREAPRAVVMGWMVAFWVLWLLRVGTLARFDHQQPQDPVVLMRWYRLWAVTSLCSGAIWGAAAWVFYGHGGTTEKIGLLFTIYSFCVAAVPVFSPQRYIFGGYASLCFLPMVVRVAQPLGPDDVLLAVVLVIIFGLTAMLARNYRMTYHNVSQLKVRAEQLMAQLRIEKAVADAARQQAEVANRAKTQFFAAASHDLRQPLHAMGLFAEALRQRSHDEEVVHLVNSINGSVDALEGLFSELLDITKIDTGGVETTLSHFNVGDIFRKLRLHFEPTAFEKGLALRFRGEKHNIHSDPVLVERILRNLVSNAIRYTNDGTVLVSCRLRGGKLVLQVWDTGVGIREREQERIFEEFYQVPYNETLSPQQRKGLGLGLAIVKRLADLIHAPLVLRSEAGRGTVFSLLVPPGKAPRATIPTHAGKAPLGLTLDHRFIVVVEDEPAVRGGLEVLLKGWGATVASFETVAATRAWAQAAGADTLTPNLLVVDYRLEHGHTGLDALQALRERFGADIPAIMVTGSTMTGHENEAQAHNFHLLVKPVVPNKLRAMIAFKLGVRAVV